MDKIIEPRRVKAGEKIKLATRLSIDELKKGKIVFYNNGKLNPCNYMQIFTRIKEKLVDMGIENFIDYTETTRGKTSQQVIDYAKNVLASEKPSAAIVAFGDKGVTPATTVICKTLEELGIPTVFITASPGTELARAVANYVAGHLCLSDFDVYQGSSVEDIDKEVEREFYDLLDALTLQGDEILERADLKIDLDRNVSDDGFYHMDGCQGEDSLDCVIDCFNRDRITDGLPIVPPTLKRYEKMMEYCPLGEDEVIAEKIGPAGSNITVKDIGVAAVMAGCKPKFMPVIITAFKALANPKYNFLQSVTTSHIGGDMVIVSGPIAKEIGMHGGQGFMGPGNVANSTIGRAINLVVTNVCRAIPGVADLGCMGSQAEYTYCFMEDASMTPWNTVNEERFDKDTTTVMVMKAEPPHGIIDFISPTGQKFLGTLTGSCTTLGSNNAYITGNLVVVLCPDHAMLLERDGYDKKMIRDHLHRHVVNHRDMLEGRGINPIRPEGFDELEMIPATKSPDHIEVIVGGGRGAQSAVIFPWACFSEIIVEPVELPDGSRAKSVEEFKKN